MEDIIFCKGGGCTAKLGAGALSRVLGKLPKKEDANLLVGFDSNDDGAVYRINDRQAIVSTLDFFPPMIEDPYLFGSVAAANALSDIYAMGGEVLTALNIVCFPEHLDMNILGKILQGGSDKVMEAGGVLAGGHSIVDEDIKYGLSVTGIVDPEHIYHNNGCREGDALILTKKLGVGIIMTAHRIKEAHEAAVDEAVASMTFLNKYAAGILRGYEVHACTDITGFGFIVHLLEMLDGAYSAVIDSARIPFFEACRAYAEEFYLTAAAQKNRNHAGDRVRFEKEDFAMEEILFDPQTSGGLLVSVPRNEAEEIVRKMKDKKMPAEIVGYVTEKQEKSVIVK
ncbi:MAG: selenide, water dikinase SelD [Lachnospiraceae bacterium]|nr:selenide, water dikinase SelD [Lachnospiraceae bacterium]